MIRPSLIIGTTVEQRKGGLSKRQNEYLCVLWFSSESSVAKNATRDYRVRQLASARSPTFLEEPKKDRGRTLASARTRTFPENSN